MANRFKVWPEQIGPLLLGAGVAGTGLTVTVNALPLLAQPPVLLLTTNVPLYAVPPPAPVGTVIAMGLAPKVAADTLTKPAAKAVASKVM